MARDCAQPAAPSGAEGGDGQGRAAAAAVPDAHPVARKPAVDDGALRDLQRLFESGDADAVGGLVADFLASVPQRLDDMRSAVARHDHDGAAWAAQTCRSNALLMGARPLSCLCADIEGAGTLGDWNEAQRHIEALKEEFERVRRVLQCELEGRRRRP